jgi:predicted HicB family RNase H-like nuclease
MGHSAFPREIALSAKKRKMSINNFVGKALKDALMTV